MARRPKLPLVWIEWEDSARSDGTWRFVEDWADIADQIVRCVSVGFLLHDGKEVIALAQNLGELDAPDAQASGVIRIPTKCVTRRKSLRQPS